MQRIKFTHDVLAGLDASNKQQNYRDLNSRLCFRVYPSGKKVFWVNIKNTKSRMVLGEFSQISIDDAIKKANQNYSSFAFKDLLERVKEYEMKTLLRSKSKIQKRWKVMKVKCQVLQEILHLDVFDKNLIIKLTELLKKIQSSRGNSAILVTYKKLAELLKISFDAGIIETLVSIKIIAQHVPEEKKRDMYIHKKEDMKAFLHVIERSEKYEIFLVAFLTCSRIGDVIDMKWKDIDFSSRKWIYQPQKQKEENKEDVHVPLSNKARTHRKFEIIIKRKVAKKMSMYLTLVIER